jgi:hypothetical protein
MISKSFSVQAFIALVVVASSLTSSVNAAAAIAPSRQFHFLSLVDWEDLLLTSNPGFARDDLPAPVIARFIEERDGASDIARINACTNSTTDVDCFITLNVLGACESLHDLENDNSGLASCLYNLCPSTIEPVIKCLTDTDTTSSDESNEALIIDPCTPPKFTSSDDLTCLRSAFEKCALNNDYDGNPDDGGFDHCMSNACPNVSSKAINCMGQNFIQEFFGDFNWKPSS